MAFPDRPAKAQDEPLQTAPLYTAPGQVAPSPIVQSTPAKTAKPRPKQAAPAPKRAETRAAGPGLYPNALRKALPLSLADAVFIGLRKNTTIRGAYLDRIAQMFDLKVAEDVFTPHARIDSAAVRTTNSGVQVDSVVVSPTVDILTPIGTQFTFAWDNAATRSNDLTTSSSSLSGSFVQPLLRGGGVEVNTASVKAARIAETNNLLALRATVSQTVTDIITAYRTLMTSQESLKLAEDSVIRAQALIEVNETLIQSGRMARVEIVQAQADLENQRLNVLQNQIQVDTARLALATLLDIDLGTEIIIRDKLIVNRSAIAAAEALTIALRARPDYLIRRNSIELARLGVVVADNNRLWDLSIVGSATTIRSSQTTTGLPRTTTNGNDTTIGMRLGVPLNDLGPEQSYIRATTSFKSAEIQLSVARRSVEQQVRQSVFAIDLNWRQLEAARRVVALASSAVDIEKQKLAVGRSSNFQVQSLEAGFRAARLQNLSAEVGYLNALTQFDLQLGTTLDTWKVSLRDQEANPGGIR